MRQFWSPLLSCGNKFGDDMHPPKNYPHVGYPPVSLLGSDPASLSSSSSRPSLLSTPQHPTPQSHRAACLFLAWASWMGLTSGSRSGATVSRGPRTACRTPARRCCTTGTPTCSRPPTDCEFSGLAIVVVVVPRAASSVQLLRLRGFIV